MGPAEGKVGEFVDEVVETLAPKEVLDASEKVIRFIAEGEWDDEKVEVEADGSGLDGVMRAIQEENERAHAEAEGVCEAPEEQVCEAPEDPVGEVPEEPVCEDDSLATEG